MLSKAEKETVDMWLRENDVYTLVPKDNGDGEVYFDPHGCTVLGDGLGNDVIDCLALMTGEGIESFDVEGVSWAVLEYITNGE